MPVWKLSRLTGAMGSVLTVVAMFASSVAIAEAQTSASTLRVEYEECDAVVRIIEKKRLDADITDGDWKKIFSSEGYRLWKQRAELIHRGLSDQDFKKFVLSDSLSTSYDSLSRTLAELRAWNSRNALHNALAYLPAGTTITANVHLLIAPPPSAYVSRGLNGTPAVVVNLQSDRSAAKIENLIAHELFHIGYSAILKSITRDIAVDTSLPSNYLSVILEIASLSEGMATLAAAGAPDNHPHHASTPEGRKRWDVNMQSFDSHFNAIDRFFLDMIGGGLTQDEIVEMDSSFHGYLGPWYTVGWKVSVTIEKALGRTTLIECIKDPRKLPAAYNQAAVLTNRSDKTSLPLFSKQLINWVER